MSFISVSHSPFSFSPLVDDSGSGDSGVDLTKHSAQIRQAAQKLVANYARISVLRVPQINIIHERNDGIMLNALILEKELSIRKSLSLTCSLSLSCSVSLSLSLLLSHFLSHSHSS